MASGLKDIHKKIAADYQRIFSQDGQGQCEARISILRAVLDREGHFTVDELRELLEQAGVSYERDFLARTLESFVHYGLVWAVRASDRPVRYEHAHLERHHDHVICVRCGRIREIDAARPRRLAEIEQATGYRVLDGQVTVRGVCEQCLAGRPEVFPLSAGAPGEEVHVVRLELTGPERKRLIGMGLAERARIEIISRDGEAGGVIAIEQSRVAVGRTVLDRIFVQAGRAPQPAVPPRAVPLTELGVGRRGRIVRITGSGPIRHRLMEMGVTRGANVFVERVAPLGDPIEVTIKGYYLAIRKNEAAQIIVEP